MFTSKRILWIIAAVVLVVAIVVIITQNLTPQTNPAFAAATNFMDATIKGEDATAFALLDADMQQYVLAKCPEGLVSECLKSYTPPEWGEAQSAVFRRAAPDGDAWDVELISNYQHDKGASGVCIYERIERKSASEWRVAGWAGFVACGDPRSRDMATNPDTPNRAP